MMSLVIALTLGRPDIMIADFEQPTYGDWTTTGTAFGPGPAQGTLPNQMPVSGYHGHGLVNSYLGGDRSIGTLTSPPFIIQRKVISFLIGGGYHPGKTGVNLLVEGKPVIQITGPSKTPQDSEALVQANWNVAEWEGNGKDRNYRSRIWRLGTYQRGRHHSKRQRKAPAQTPA
jgi:fructan beta-fructosidase